MLLGRGDVDGAWPPDEVPGRFTLIVDEEESEERSIGADPIDRVLQRV